jgi:hypothetical protein
MQTNEHKQTNERTNEQAKERMNEWMNEWEQTNEWMNKRMNEQKNEWREGIYLLSGIYHLLSICPLKRNIYGTSTGQGNKSTGQIDDYLMLSTMHLISTNNRYLHCSLLSSGVHQNIVNTSTTIPCVHIIAVEYSNHQQRDLMKEKKLQIKTE